MTGGAATETRVATPAGTPGSRLSQVAGRATAAAGFIPLGLALIAEAAWISILAGLFQLYARREAALDIVVMLVFVAAGLAFHRLFAREFGERWPVVAVGLIILAALAGVLFAPSAWSTVVAGGPAAILQAAAMNPGGLLAGLAVLRGIGWGHAGLPLPEDRLLRLVGGGLLAVTLAALAGSLVVEPQRSHFLAEALGSGVAFVACAIVALALTRQAIAAGDVGAAWQRNPTWVVALLLLMAGVIGLALALSGQVRPALELIVGAAALPIIVLGLIGGWTRRTFRIAFIVSGAVALLTALGSALERFRTGTEELRGGGGGSTESAAIDNGVAAGAAGVVTIVAVLIVLLLVRLWMRQLRLDAADPIEERYVDRSVDAQARPRRRLRRRFGSAPVDAVAAYRTLLTDIADRPGVQRQAWETPREHAARLRGIGAAGLSLDLLAADYGLARFGGVELSAGENRRAVGRWRRLRRSLREGSEAQELGPERS